VVIDITQRSTKPSILAADYNCVLVLKSQREVLLIQFRELHDSIQSVATEGSRSLLS
jgi:hypothetical protein